MVLTVHVDIVKRTGLAISRSFFLATTPWLILQLKKKKRKREKIKREMNSTLPKDTE